MQLHLLRHAKTNQISPTGKDFDRELLPRGYVQIDELKRYLQNHPIAPKHILCSTALRTRQTLAALIALWPAAAVQYIDELYLASKHEILHALCALNSPDDVLVVGHNEGLSELTIYLSNQAVWHKTCGLASLTFPFESSNYISGDTGNITAMFRVV